MIHHDERILELFVLDALEIQDQKEQIRAHLRNCWGCKNIVDEITEFHATLEIELREQPRADLSAQTALIQSRHSIEPRSDFPPMSTPYPEGKIAQRLWYFVRRYPRTTAATALSFAGIIGFLLSFSIWKFNGKGLITDTNPMHSMYNIENNTLEVLNKDDQLLWQAKIPDANGAAVAENITKTHTTIICDLNSDGRNEILTTVPFVSFHDVNGNHLRIFDGDRKLLKDFQPKEIVRYKNRTDEYSRYISLYSLLDRETPNGKKEIFVLGNSVGRSPCVLFRMNEEGNTIGEYWHFGQFGALYYGDTTSQGRAKLILGGTNDTKDVTHEEFPVIVVMNPDKIVGQRRATTCPDFLLDPTDAEMLYIQLPISDLDTLLHTHGSVIRFTDNDDQSYEAVVRSGTELGNPFDLHYYFDHSLRSIRVKSNNITDALHKRYVNEHKLKGLIDRDYLDNLRNQIRYWNGNRWVQSIVGVGSVQITPSEHAQDN